MTPFCVREFKVAFFHCCQDCAIVVAIEWRITTEKNVCNDTATPNVALLVVASLQYLRCDIIWRSSLCCHGWISSFKPLGEPEVDDLDLCFSCFVLHQEILGLDITMAKAFAVQVAHSSKDLLHVSRSSTLVKCCCTVMFIRLCYDAIKELASCAHLHDQVEPLGICEYLVEFHDVGMVESCLDIHLDLEPLWLFDLDLVYGLDGTNSSGVSVLTLAHQSIAALTDNFLFHFIDFIQLVGIFSNERMRKVSSRCRLQLWSHSYKPKIQTAG
mmetsp:Transcript_5731/g.10302  ORF Transcript_5731/g.10302 Transcript_5731/m.10302 type:complete len:271 (+) Transcript_5731:828-1640(+)